MRELKPRWWDKENDRMIYPGDRPYWISPWGFPIYNETKLDWEPMMPTGLKDKNGKEIYEGDILDGSYVNPMSQEKVKRHYEVTFRKGNCYAELIGHHPYGTTMLYFENEKSEVIGNIYEHAHLLPQAPESNEPPNGVGAEPSLNHH